MLSHVELLTRIATGAMLGGVIGFERDRHRRPVGLRTHLIVAMTAATFMVISSQFVYYQHYGKDDFINVDASRIAASVVSGIGFLAGGAILRTGLTIQGLTTAAGLWLVTAIGMCAGAGMLVEAAVVTGMGIVALTVLRRLEDKNDQLIRFRLSVVAAESNVVTSIVHALTALGVTVANVEYERRLGEKRRVTATFDVQIVDTLGLPKLVECVEIVPGVLRVHVRQPM